MLKKVIAGWNAAPGAPKNWNPERDGDCGALPIRVRTRTDGMVISCESAWEPTPRELEMLNAGGQVILHVAGWQVPVALYVEPLPEDARVPA
jgi:hypothetical protein